MPIGWRRAYWLALKWLLSVAILVGIGFAISYVLGPWAESEVAGDAGLAIRIACWAIGGFIGFFSITAAFLRIVSEVVSSVLRQ